VELPSSAGSPSFGSNAVTKTVTCNSMNGWAPRYRVPFKARGRPGGLWVRLGAGPEPVGIGACTLE